MSRNFVSASSQYLELASAVVTAAPFTFAAWVRAAHGTGNNRAIFSLSNSASDVQFFQLMLTAGEFVDAVVSDGVGAIDTTTAVQAPNNQWCHVACVYASNISRSVYLNGGNKVSTINDRTPLSVNRTAIGRLTKATPSRFFQGNIGFAALWNGVVSDADIARLAAGSDPRDVRPDLLLPLWELSSGANPEPDTWKGVYPLVVNGATFTSDAPPVFSRAAALTGRGHQRIPMGSGR